MKLLFSVCLLAFSTMVLTAQPAAALYVDDSSMSSENAAAKFSDPDEKTPVFLQGDASKANGSVDPSSVQYDYDASTGNYVPSTGAHSK